MIGRGTRGSTTIPAGRGARSSPPSQPLGDGLLNLAHLDFLSEEVRLDGQPVLLTHIYCEAPEYRWADASGEGIAAVDDVARAAIVYLDYWAATGDGPALERARAGLNFVLRMQTGRGEFYNFVLDRQGTINTSGPTSRKPLDWWAFRGIWALACGYAVFNGVDRDYAERLRAAYLRTERLIATHIGEVGRMTTAHGFVLPAWLPNGSAAGAAIAALALAEYQAVAPNPQTAAALTALADGLRDYQLGGPGEYPWGLHPPSLATPGFWHAWGAHEAQALARAGKVLGRSDWIAGAKRELDLFFAWQLANERVHEMGALPFVQGQQSYGVNCMVQAAMAVHRATGEVRYARMAGLHAAWLFGNNLTGAPLYDPATGRGFDGIDGRGSDLRVSAHAGAESTIEALMALQAVLPVPEAARYLDYKRTGGHGWRVLEAEEGRTVAGTPAYSRRGWTGEARFSGACCELRDDDAIVLTFDLPQTGPYLLYVAHLRRAGGDEQPAGPEPAGRAAQAGDPARVALGVQLDGGERWVVPQAVSPDRDYLWLDAVTAQPLQLSSGRHTLRLSYAGSDRSRSAIVDGFLLQPALATKTLRSPDGRELRLGFDMLSGTLSWDE